MTFVKELLNNKVRKYLKMLSRIEVKAEPLKVQQKALVLSQNVEFSFLCHRFQSLDQTSRVNLTHTCMQASTHPHTHTHTQIPG